MNKFETRVFAIVANGGMEPDPSLRNNDFSYRSLKIKPTSSDSRNVSAEGMYGPISFCFYTDEDDPTLGKLVTLPGYIDGNVKIYYTRVDSNRIFVTSEDGVTVAFALCGRDTISRTPKTGPSGREANELLDKPSTLSFKRVSGDIDADIFETFV